MDVRATTRHHACRLGTIAGFAAWCALVVLLLAGLGTAASANPFFFSKTGQDCKFCHQQGREMSGVQGLNETGRAFLQVFKRCPDCALRDFARNGANRGGQGGQGPQRSSGGTFTFRVCNSSSVPKIGIAVRYQSRPGFFRSVGWYHVNAGQCTNIGPFPKGPFWFHPEESGTTHPSIQWGSGSQFCLERAGKFDFEVASHTTCDTSKLAQAFYADVQDDTYTWRASNRGAPTANTQSECQNLCVRQYNACRQENGPNCLTLRQGCWDRCRMSGQSAPPQIGGNKFHFHVCNRSRHTAHIAVSYKVSSNPDYFETRGWTNLDPGACANLGPYPKGPFWYYAYSSSGKWTGNTKICVDKNAGFVRRYRRGTHCDGHHVKFNFHEVQIDQYNWNLDN